MRNEIINLLENRNKALSIEDIANELKIEDVNVLKELYNELSNMTEDYTLYHTNKDRYMLFSNNDRLVKGIISTNKKGFGFVEGGDTSTRSDDVYVSQDNMNGAIHGDLVIVEVTSRKSADRKEGRILKIIKRNIDDLVGEITFDNNDVGHILLDDKKIKLDITVKREDALGSVSGHKVLVHVDENKDGKASGHVVKVIGHKNDPGTDILSIVYKYKINDTFSDELMDSLKDIPEEVTESDIKGRTDLRDEVIFTIDGDDTKDIDDAISIEKLDNGNYKLGVHIADVSYYIEEGSILDVEAMSRGTSVYLVDRVIPMYPHKLSNGICSLNPNVDRLAISCSMEIDNTGKVVDYNIFLSVIKSKIQMTYKKVNNILDNNIVAEGYEPFVDKLHLFKELSDIVRKSMIKRGYIDFAVDEAKILVDEECHPTEIKIREQGTGEEMIENFMVLANETVAKHIFYMNLPFIYRIHEYPKEEKIRNFLSFTATLGYHFNGNLKDCNPKVIQSILDELKDKNEYKILSALLLRCMQKAVYSSENLGHYALALKCYTHFTSPIRRYPDTTVHRLLHKYLFDTELNNDIINHWKEKIPVIAEVSSQCEQASVNCEREVDNMKMAEYMEDHIGEEYEGMISSVLSFGMFVQLDNMIEGLVPIKDMDDFYHYDEDRLTLVGERTHKKYRIGDRIKVKVVRANKNDMTIDFSIVD